MRTEAISLATGDVAHIEYPDLTAWRPVYRFRLTFTYRGEPQTIELALRAARSDMLTLFELQRDVDVGHFKLGGPKHRVVGAARSAVLRAAFAELRAGGWTSDDGSLWDCPMSVWRSALTTIQDGGW